MLAALLVSATEPRSATQGDVDNLAASLGYRFAILDNHMGNCPGGAAQCFLSVLTIHTPKSLPASLTGGITIHYNYVTPLLHADSDVFADTLVNGDLHRLTLKPGARLAPNHAYRIELWGAGHFFSAYHAMPNAYLSAPGLQPRTIAAARAAIDPETGIEYLPFVAPMTDEAKLASAGAGDATRWFTPERAFAAYAERGTNAAPPEFAIIPKPMAAHHLGGAAIDLSHGVTVRLSGVDRAAIAPALAYLHGAIGGDFAGGPSLSVTVGKQTGVPAEGYRLRTAAGGVRIEAADAAGASYALRSLAQQAQYEGGRLRPLAIDDAPLFAYRGVHLDIARNFHSKAEILKLIDAMAAYKLNKLHLHLADDEGWRLQIKALPELTEIGSKRCGDASETTCLEPQLGAGPSGSGPSNGYLSQADYIEIVRAAATRQIEVIPSFDMPGHSRAAIRSMEVRYHRLNAAGETTQASEYRLVEPDDITRYRSIQNYDDNTLNVCLPATYRFLGTALDEVIAMHRAAGAPLRKFHIGADETAGAWTGSPACRRMMAAKHIAADRLGAYFIERVAAMIAARGIEVAGWSDGLSHTATASMPRRVQSDIWGGLFTGGVAEAHEQANRGWDVVLSMPDFGYLDMPYAPDPNERGYDWATRGVDTFQIFGFMPENLPANAEFIKDIDAQPQTIMDPTPLAAGRHIVGIQAQLWSETVRGDAAVDYMLFPRLLALAERAWRRPSWAPPYHAGQSYRFGGGRVDRSAMLAGWRDFAGRVSAQLPLLDHAGIAYRLAPPGARVANGTFTALPEFPGMAIQYRTAGGAWRRYDRPVAVKAPVETRSVAPDGRPGRSVRAN
ncbi:beta-N-acetylhexosaminidase [Sphingomonas koreensis]|nr:beta-N-acetylhexosaminidase [Sphingomonas koreensis]